jgi:hypothetical protein
MDLDLEFEMSSNERLNRSIYIYTNLARQDLEELYLRLDSIEFNKKLLKGLIDIDLLINDIIERDLLLVNLNRNCSN